MELIWDLWNGSSKLIYSKKKSCSGKPSDKKVLVGKISFRSFSYFKSLPEGFFGRVACSRISAHLHLLYLFPSWQLWRAVLKAHGRDCLSLMDRSTNSTQPDDLGSFDKCTHISKVFSSQGRPLLAAFTQINVSTSVLFCLVFWPPEGLCCVLQPLFEACCKHTS